MARGIAERHQRRRRGGLGRTVGVHELEARQHLRELLDGRLGHGRAAIGADAPGRQIERPEIRLEQAQVVHRRHHHGMGDPLRRRDLQEPARLEARQQHRGAADMDHGEEHREQTGDVGCRHGKERAIVGPEPHARLVVQHRVDDVQMREHRAFGAAGGPGGVQDDRHVLLARTIRRRRSALVEQGRKRRLASWRRAHGDPSVLSPILGQPGGELGVVDQQPGAAVLEHVAKTRRLLPGAKRHRDGAEPGGGADRDQELRPIVDQQRQAVPWSHASRREAGGEPLSLSGEVAVGQSDRPRDQGQSVRIACDRRLEQTEQALRALGEAAHQTIAEVQLVADRGQRIVGPGHDAQPRCGAAGGIR